MATRKNPATSGVEKAVPVAASPVTAKPKAAVTKAPAKKAPVKKAPAKVAAAAKPVPVTKAAPAQKAKAPARKKALAAARSISPEQRANYIEVAAFYIAERRGFAPGNTEADWLQAAAEIDRLIAAGHFG